ncbi:hypothetical protein SUDANB120_06633 (plasmid) [Streptomyces sp. enrichment culture]|uniref:hypothetical protein n=1 Tax=Streptomyces sp. enrichment culture TaxID=1795815 RepID=UPI003F574A29
MSAESDVTVAAGILALLYRITPAALSEGPAGTATRNHVAEDRTGRRWFVKAYPRGTDVEAERQAPALGEAARVAAPNAVVAIMGDGSLWTHETDWTAALRGLIQTCPGKDRRAGTRGAHAGRGRSYEEGLADSAFSDVAEHRFPVARARRPENVIGYLRTTSFAHPVHHEFEDEALRLLQGHARGGVLTEDAEFTVLLARRPGGDA